jgi:hypothetical protein
MNKQEASKQISAQYKAWASREKSRESAETFVDFLGDAVGTLRKIEVDQDLVDLSVDSALRIALIAVSLHLKHYDFIFQSSGRRRRYVISHVIFYTGAEYLHSSIQHALDGFITGTRPIHSIERLGLRTVIEENLVLNGAVTISQMVSLFNSGWVTNIGKKRMEEVRWAHDLYRDKRPVPTAILPVQSECDLPFEIPKVDNFLPAYLGVPQPKKDTEDEKED